MLLKYNSLKKNKFLKNSLLYTIGSMMTPAIGLIMLPIFTRYLNPAEYGVMTTVQSLTGLLQLILLLSLHGAVSRFYYDFLDRPEKQREYLGSIFIFVVIFSTLISILLLVFNDFIGTLLFKNIPINPYYFYLIGLAWGNSLLSLPLAMLRAQEKAGTFVSINVIKALLTMGLTLYLLIVKDSGAESALISQMLITIIIILVTYLMQSKNLKISLNTTYVKQSLLFSLPLLPHVASGWVINASDRVILEKFVNVPDLGIYALATQVAMVLSLFYSSINTALVPRYTILRKEGKELQANKLLSFFSYIIIIVGLISIPIAMYAVKLITTSEYHAAIIMIPFLLIGQICTGFYFIPVAKLFYAKRTTAIASSSTLAALVNIIINFIAIPFIGVYGAIVSTIVAEILRFLFIYRASKRV